MALNSNPEMEVRHRSEELECGMLYLDIQNEELPLDELVGFAARMNPARPFSFVSRVIGKHIPTRPQRLRAVAKKLAERIPVLEGPVLFVGMAEMGVTLGQAVFDAWIEITGGSGLYVDSTRVDLAESEFIAFSEDHSHASAHRLHVPSDLDARQVFFESPSVVIVDDEVTTGRTAENLFRAIAAARGGEVFEQFLVSAVSWAPTSSLKSESLVVGRMEFIPRESAAGDSSSSDDFERVSLPAASSGSRGGICFAEQLPAGIQVSVKAGGRYLVIGTGEFGFLPLRFAELIEAKGAEAFLQSTSRSPLHIGNAILHRREFPSLCGGQWREYLYNVDDDHGFDGVFLCVEAPDVLPSEHPLLQIPGLESMIISR